MEDKIEEEKLRGKEISWGSPVELSGEVYEVKKKKQKQTKMFYKLAQIQLFSHWHKNYHE